MKVSLSIFNFKPSTRFLFKLTLFLVLLVAIDRIVGLILLELNSRVHYSYNWTKENWLLEERFDVVIFGSSRAFRHYKPSIISEEVGLSVFNAGQNGQYLLYAYALEQLVLERYSPMIIILDILPSFIAKVDNPQEEHSRLASLSPYIHNSAVKKLLVQDNFFEQIKYSSHIFRYNSRILGILSNMRPPADRGDNGFECVGDVRFYDRNPFIVDTLDKVEIDSFKLDIFKSFITSAKEKSIPVIVSFSPVSSQLSDNVQELLDFYQTLLRDMDVVFLNFAAPEYADKNLFIDLIHMDSTGAEIFSRDFGARLASLCRQSIFVSEL